MTSKNHGKSKRTSYVTGVLGFWTRTFWGYPLSSSRTCLKLREAWLKSLNPPLGQFSPFIQPLKTCFMSLSFTNTHRTNTLKRVKSVCKPPRCCCGQWQASVMLTPLNKLDRLHFGVRDLAPWRDFKTFSLVISSPPANLLISQARTSSWWCFVSNLRILIKTTWKWKAILLAS